MYRIPKHVMGTELENEYVILHLKTGDYFHLNTVGAEIWQMLLEGVPARSIVEALARQYDAPIDILENDFRELVGNLKAHGLLEETQDNG